MSSFTPSEKFNDRWLNSPNAMKQAIYNELDDIIRLLKEETKLNGFNFTSPDLNSKLSHLQTAHLQTLKNLEQKRRQERADELLPQLEQALDAKLQQKINERLYGLDDELKQWIRQVIQEELTKDITL